MPDITLNEALGFLPYIYFAAISLIAGFFTCYDQYASKKLPGRRTPESTLLIISILGGSAAMLATMLAIRHKTKHKKFMIGIPVIIILQLAAGAAIWFFT
jgi:uncharacterized membrane protein YsdA (DUF1294 family)